MKSIIQLHFHREVETVAQVILEGGCPVTVSWLVSSVLAINVPSKDILECMPTSHFTSIGLKMKCPMDSENFQALFHYPLRLLSPYLWCGARALYQFNTGIFLTDFMESD